MLRVGIESRLQAIAIASPKIPPCKQPRLLSMPIPAQPDHRGFSPKLLGVRYVRAYPASRMAYAPRAHPVHNARKYATPKHPAGLRLSRAPLHTTCPRPAYAPSHVRRARGPTRALPTPSAKAQLRATPRQPTENSIQLHQLEERVRCAGGEAPRGWPSEHRTHKSSSFSGPRAMRGYPHGFMVFRRRAENHQYIGVDP